jgi:signal recognition particle subunit SEC65
MKTRADRRQASAKALKRGRKIAKSWGVKDPKEIESIARHRRDTPAGCSCSMFCNKRRSDYLKPKEKLTTQERRAVEPKREDI